MSPIGLLAAAAAVVASAGDILLLQAVQSAAPSTARILVGQYLGVLAIPLYAAGYWQVSRVLAPASQRSAHRLFLLGAYSAAIGAVVHGMTGVAIAQFRAATEGGRHPFAVFEPLAADLLPLWGVLLALAVAVAVLQYRLVRASARARWLGLASPAVLVVVIAALSPLVPEHALTISNAGPNLAHIAYFTLFAFLRPAAP